jgi:RNA polymerase sigma factor (sigma-70 family)
VISEHTYFGDDELKNLSDEEAWNRFKRGDKNAFEHIFKKYNRVLHHFGVKFFYDRNVVEDCIQELFLKLWKNREKLAEVNTVKYYLVTSLRRSLLSNRRLLKRQSDINHIMSTCSAYLVTLRPV